MKYLTLALFSIISGIANAFSTAPAPAPTNVVPEPETLALIGIAGIAAIVAKHFRKK